MQFAKGDRELKTIMFTSTGPGEGKSTIAANTAVALAQAGKKVIIIDCDLRKPVQHKNFGKKNRGVTNILVEGLDTAGLIQATHIENLYILPSGPIPPNPSELLSTRRMVEVIEHLKAQADYVIVDVPPVIAVTDACVMASKVDGINLVVSAGLIRPEMAQKAKELLLKAKGHLLGVTLNRIEIEAEHRYYYYYYGKDNAAR
jgi:capsular exopolysaccharide synthesis family protein